MASTDTYYGGRHHRRYPLGVAYPESREAGDDPLPLGDTVVHVETGQGHDAVGSGDRPGESNGDQGCARNDLRIAKPSTVRGRLVAWGYRTRGWSPQQSNAAAMMLNKPDKTSLDELLSVLTGDDE